VTPCSVWRWRQHGPPKRWYPTTTPHGVKTQNTSIWIFTAMKTSKLSERFTVHLNVTFCHLVY